MRNRLTFGLTPRVSFPVNAALANWRNRSFTEWVGPGTRVVWRSISR